MDGLEWGPPYYPESFGWDPGRMSRFGGGDWPGGPALDQSGHQAVGHGAKRGKLATRWQSQVSETNHFHCAAPQYPIVSWNAYWQLAAANLLPATQAISIPP